MAICLLLLFVILDNLELTKSFIKKTVIKKVNNFPIKISKNKCQGYILDKDFMSGDTKKRSKSGDGVVQGSGHQLDTANLKNGKKSLQCLQKVKIS